MQLEEGQRISAPFLSGVAEVKRFAPKRVYYLLEVVLQDRHHTYQPLRITEDQLAAVQVLSWERAAPAGNAEDFFFTVEATRIRLAYQFALEVVCTTERRDHPELSPEELAWRVTRRMQGDPSLAREDDGTGV